MNLIENLNTIIQGVILLAIGMGVKGIFSMNKRLGDMNGSVREIIVWKTEHEKKDAEHFQSMQDGFKAIWNKLQDHG